MISHDTIIQGCDSSFSVYNAAYQQSYHSKSLGAYTETLLKHIFPALFLNQYGSFCNKATQRHFLQQVDYINQYISNQISKTPHESSKQYLHELLHTLYPQAYKYTNRPLRILDICFGLGYNAMFALQYFPQCEIYSPEKDDLLTDLLHFPYQHIPQSKEIVASLQAQRYYRNVNQSLYYLHGDAREYIAQCGEGYFDIVFQDAFSQKHNPELWDTRYFQSLFRRMATPCVITTYAKARCVLQSAKTAGFGVLKYSWGSLFFR